MRADSARALMPALGALLLAGCFTTKTLKTLDQEVSARDSQVSAAEALEKTSPEKALAQYQEFLKQEADFDKPLLYYQNQLKMQLRQMRTSYVQVLGDHVLAAFPHYFHRRLRMLVRTHLGLARLYLARNDLAEAEKSAKAAADLVNRRARSALFMAQEGKSVYDFLNVAYRREGGAGKALLAKLNEDLLADYLGSAEAAQESQREKDDEQKAEDQIREIEQFIAQVNRQRTAKAAADLASIISQAASGWEMSDAASGAAKALASSMQMASAVASAYAGVPAAEGVDSTLSPMSSPILIRQLLDPASAGNPRKIIKEFANAAMGLGGGPGLRKAAENVSAQADGVLAARQWAGGDKKIEAIKSFAGALAALQSEVQQVRSTDIHF